MKFINQENKKELKSLILGFILFILFSFILGELRSDYSSSYPPPEEGYDYNSL